MGSTATYLLPYPELDEPDDVPADLKELADRLEIVLPTFQQVAKYGQPNGYAPLGADGKVPLAYLPAAASGSVLRKVTQKDVNNTTTATDLLNGEFTIPANALSATSRAYLVAAGDFLNNSGSTRNEIVTLILGGNTVWQSNAFGVSASANRRGWRLTAELIPISSSVVKCSGTFTLSPAAVAGSGIGGVDQGNAGYSGTFEQNNAAANLTTALALAFTIQHATASGQLQMRLEHARMEFSA